MDALLFVDPDGRIDLVALAECIDASFDAAPSDRTDPQLFVLFGTGADSEVAEWPDIDHFTLMWRVVPPPDCPRSCCSPLGGPPRWTTTVGAPCGRACTRNAVESARSPSLATMLSSCRCCASLVRLHRC